MFNQSFEPIIKIIADGRLAYIGFLSHAAYRQDVPKSQLLAAARVGASVKQPESVLWRESPWGNRYRAKPAQSYTAHVVEGR